MKYVFCLKNLFFVALFVVSGCAVQHTDPSSLTENVRTEIPNQYHEFQLEECQQVQVSPSQEKKVDNFMIIFDPSASMTETYVASDDCIVCHEQFKEKVFSDEHAVAYGGREYASQDKVLNSLRCAECHQDFLYSKFKFAQELVTCFNQAIPNLEVMSALRTFGSPVYTMISHGPEQYSKKKFSYALRKITDADGVSPLGKTLIEAGRDWFGSSGKIAVIVVSDGKDMEEKEVLAAEILKDRYFDRMCIYTIQVGNDANGKVIMERIAQAGECGLAVNGDLLLDRQDMEVYVKDIFLKEKAPKPEVARLEDSDEDGVPDVRDDCPDTPAGVVVDDNGCWKLIIQADLLFDFDKYVFKPRGIEEMTQLVGTLKKYPFLKLHISGHCDNSGSMEYNIRLSKNRAAAGFNYLIEKGIVRERLTYSWHSFSKPRATNETKEGRALNRRLEFNFSR